MYTYDNMGARMNSTTMTIRHSIELHGKFVRDFDEATLIWNKVGPSTGGAGRPIQCWYW